jgi:3-oxoacyl-[acyl-carrier-protein] synthase II
VTGPGQVAVVAWSLHLPGVDVAAAVPELAAVAPGAGHPACPPERARELLGRKGLLNKDPATRLALCAVHRALGRPAGAPPAGGPVDPATAVVASSNLGNVATVAGIVAAVRTGGHRAVSPLAAPNASSNALASAVAIWFRFGGPNVMLCSGATSGLDALAVGALLLRAGRADRVVVVGAEPADGAAAALPGLPDGIPPRAGAACVVLAPAGAGPAAPRLGPVHTTATRPAAGGPALVLGPAGGPAAPGVIDLAARCGDLYGALGVAQAAVAAAVVGATGRPACLVGGDDVDGWRTVGIQPSTGGCGAASPAG